MYRSLMFDEEKLAFEIFTNGFTKGYFNFGESVLVAKYFRHTLGYGDARTKTALLSFCEDKDNFFRRVLYMGKVKTAVLRSRKMYINKSNSIPICQSEIDKINSLENYRSKKVLFAVLILTKLDKKEFFPVYKWSNIRVVLRSKITNSKLRTVFAEYSHLGLIESTYFDSHKILFIDQSRPVFEITQKHIYNLNKVFVDLFGRDLFICSDCRIEHERKSHNQIRCSDCSKIRRKEKKKMESKRYRARLKNVA